ncbi:unnamed protein product [Prunus armeniaca]
MVSFQKCGRCVFFKGRGAFSKIWSDVSLCKSSRAYPCKSSQAYPCKSGRMLPSQKVGPNTP